MFFLKKLFGKKKQTEEHSKGTKPEEKQPTPEPKELTEEEKRAQEAAKKAAEEAEAAHEAFLALMKEPVSNALQHLLEEAKEKMPEEKWFKPFGYQFSVPGTTNSAVVLIAPRPSDASKKNVRVFVCRDGTDRAYNHIFFTDWTSQGIRAYLSSEWAIEEITNSIEELSKKADDYWD